MSELMQGVVAGVLYLVIGYVYAKLRVVVHMGNDPNIKERSLAELLFWPVWSTDLQREPGRHPSHHKYQQMPNPFGKEVNDDFAMVLGVAFWPISVFPRLLLLAFYPPATCELFRRTYRLLFPKKELAENLKNGIRVAEMPLKEMTLEQLIAERDKVKASIRDNGERLTAIREELRNKYVEAQSKLESVIAEDRDLEAAMAEMNQDDLERKFDGLSS